MAADFSTAPAVVSPPAFQQHAYKTSAPYTPMTSGTTTPANVSPTSPRNTSNLSTLHLHTRPPKSPLYVPAVLRPTEKPARQSPPKNVDSSLDSADSSWSASGRRATGDSLESGISRVVTEEWNEEIQGPVTGPPSRNHWKVRISQQSCNNLATISYFYHSVSVLLACRVLSFVLFSSSFHLFLAVTYNPPLVPGRISLRSSSRVFGIPQNFARMRKCEKREKSVVLCTSEVTAAHSPFSNEARPYDSC